MCNLIVTYKGELQILVLSTAALELCHNSSLMRTFLSTRTSSALRSLARSYASLPDTKAASPKRKARLGQTLSLEHVSLWPPDRLLPIPHSVSLSTLRRSPAYVGVFMASNRDCKTVCPAHPHVGLVQDNLSRVQQDPKSYHKARNAGLCAC